jgi:hypothetical protein
MPVFDSDVIDGPAWLQDELRSLPIDSRIAMLADAIRFNQSSWNIEEADTVNSVLEMVKAIDCVMPTLSRANRFHVSNILRDLSDRIDHLPPKGI